MADDQTALPSLESSLHESKSSVNDLLKSLGLNAKSTMAEFSKAVSNRGGAPQQPGSGGNFLESGLNALTQHWDTSEKPVTGLADWLTSSLKSGPTGAGTSGASSKAKPKESTKLPAPAKASESPFTELSQALAQEYLGQVQQLQSLTSGAQTPAAESEAQGGAEAALKGLGVGAAGQQFVANQPAVPLSGQVAQSQQALGNAQSAGALGMAGAIGNMGPAEAAGLEAAPYSTLLNELVNEVAYRASSPTYGASAFGATTANTPAWLQSILGSVGLPVPKPGATGSALTTPGLSTPTKAATGGSSSNSSVPGSSGVTGGP